MLCQRFLSTLCATFSTCPVCWQLQQTDCWSTVILYCHAFWGWVSKLTGKPPLGDRQHALRAACRLLAVTSARVHIWASSKSEALQLRYMQLHQHQTPELSSAQLPGPRTVPRLQVLVPVGLQHGENWFSLRSFTGLKKAIPSRPLCIHITVSSGLFPRLRKNKNQTKQKPPGS